VHLFIYEGLVAFYGNGEILPSLATRWMKATTAEGQRYIFTLREGVKFHDGGNFNCTAAS
jgi:peptide/nickel transport system substrate-binding protein